MITGINIEDKNAMTFKMILIVGMLFCVSSIAAAQTGWTDPTRPVGARADAEPTYSGPVLQSTMISHGRKRAIISGKTYAVGERVGAAVITDIRPYEVVLNQDGRETRLRLVPSLLGEAAAKNNQNKGVNP
jgi:hypothetical protein